ncbi:hypothetical protein WN943_025942 [Citrus x changshan-huyou]
MCGSKRVWVSELIFILLVVKGWWSEGCLEQEKSALLQLRHFFNDDQHLQNWSDAGDEENYSDCCQWEGVECNYTTGRSLDLIGNNIAGCVENEGLERLSRLKDLKVLFLDNNYFNNSIFSSLGGLSSLKRLSLASNELNGSIDIKGLDSLSNLEELYMSFNAIDNLVVPEGGTEIAMIDGSKVLQSIGSLPSLKTLYLSCTNFTGTVVNQELHNFTNLEELILDESDLHVSQLLQSIASFTSLKYLSMQGCVLKGALHGQDFRKFKNLENLDMGKVQVHVNTSFLQIVGESMPSLNEGPTSSSCGRASGYASSYVKTALNKTATPTSSSCGRGCPYARDYVGSRTPPMGKEETIQFTTKNMSYYYQGRILTSMSGIDLSCNRLTGEISTQIGYLTKIHALNLSHNNLTGTIPTTFSNLKQIESLDLSYNLLHGKIPSQLTVLNTLAVFTVAYNNLSGKIPNRVA